MTIQRDRDRVIDSARQFVEHVNANGLDGDGRFGVNVLIDAMQGALGMLDASSHEESREQAIDECARHLDDVDDRARRVVWDILSRPFRGAVGSISWRVVTEARKHPVLSYCTALREDESK